MNIKNVLVCVTQQKTCEKLINKAYELANKSGDSLYIINVVKDNVNFLDSHSESEALEYLFSISKKLNANMSVIKADDVPGAIAEYAQDNDINCIVLGKSPSGNTESSFAKKLRKVLKNSIKVKILS